MLPQLISYQKAEIIYDATVYFTGRFLCKGDRTIDQMVQAARSGKENIAKPSQASGTLSLSFSSFSSFSSFVQPKAAASPVYRL